MKRQDTTLISSSSRRQNSPENLRAHTVGCMSGIFHLLSKYHNRRKFLTFGKKQEKRVTSSTSPKKAAKSSAITGQSSPLLKEQHGGDHHHHHHHEKNNERGTTLPDLRRLSCDVPRSPTLPAEIRRSNFVNSPENYPTPPAIVARLMGLDGSTTPPGSSSATEKRQKLLGALERCDQDLKALKKIIEAVQSQPVVFKSTVNLELDHDDDDHNKMNGGLRQCSAGGDNEEEQYCVEKKLAAGKRCLLDLNSEQPSPVSVLDELTRSPLCSYTRRSHITGRGLQQQKQQQKKKPGEEDIINLSLFDRIIMTETYQTRSTEKAAAAIATTSKSPSPLGSSSKAMIESVNEACRDIAWGEKREVGRIGLALQDQICKDLIEEFVKEMGYCHNCMYSLPFEACKRKLRF